MSDTAIASSIQSLFIGSSLGTAVAVFLAQWLILVYAIFLAWLWKSRQSKLRHAISHCIWSLIVALSIVAIVAFIVGRPRPFLADLDSANPIMLLISPPFHSSFPSGHTAASVAMAAAIYAANRRLGIAAFAVAALVALGRVAVGVHYPTDLLGGIGVGLASYALVSFGHRQMEVRS